MRNGTPDRRGRLDYPVSPNQPASRLPAGVQPRGLLSFFTVPIAGRPYVDGPQEVRWPCIPKQWTRRSLRSQKRTSRELVVHASLKGDSARFSSRSQAAEGVHLAVGVARCGML